jgi:hypothetical protein
MLCIWTVSSVFTFAVLYTVLLHYRKPVSGFVREVEVGTRHSTYVLEILMGSTTTVFR